MPLPGRFSSFHSLVVAASFLYRSKWDCEGKQRGQRSQGAGGRGRACLEVGEIAELALREEVLDGQEVSIPPAVLVCEQPVSMSA